MPGKFKKDKQTPPPPLKIHDTEVPAGKHAIVRIPVGQLPSGNVITIRAHVFRSKKPGPVLLVLGGIHGDEINGIEIVRRSLEMKFYQKLVCGSVVAIPLLNIYGFINYSRDVPDGKDVNRSFPGASKGSLAARVAHTLHKIVLPHVTCGIDFHTGGSGNHNHPQTRYTPGDEKARELALAFGAPLTLPYKAIAKSLRKSARDHYNVPIVIFEGGENRRYDGYSIEIGLSGIRRLMHQLGMIEEQPAPVETLSFEKTTWLRASRAGMFEWMKASGSFVRKGEALGVITDPLGIRPTRRIYATHDGYIIGHNNSPVVNAGDALFHIGYNDSAAKD